MKKLNFIWIAASVILVVLTIGIFSSCQKMEFNDPETSNLLKPISLSDIPEGIMPVHCKDMKDAENFLKRMMSGSKGECQVSVHIGEVPKNALMFPLMLTKSETSNTTLNPGGWWFNDLDVYFSYDYIGGPITLNSYMTGLIIGAGWTQTGYTAKWNGSSIEYTIKGNEEYYLVVEGVGHVYSNPIEVSGTFNP